MGGRGVNCGMSRNIRRPGGGWSWHFKFAWEISRFKLTAKFRVLRGFLAHPRYTRWGLWRGVPHKIPGAP